MQKFNTQGTESKMKEYPKISIVTTSYNQGQFLEETICSVLDQGYPNLEYIIVDGGSSDDSVEIIKKYEKHLVWWVSEPDNGQSNALNKGFKRATGDIMAWVNSDDVLLPKALSNVAKAYASNPDCEWFAAKCLWINKDGCVIKCGCAENWYSILPRLEVLNVYGPTTFFTKALLERVGYVDEEFHYMMDTELWWRFYKVAGASFVRINSYLWGLRMHSKSKTSGHHFDNNDTAHDPNHPKWQQWQKERDIMAKRYCLGIHKGLWLGRILSKLMRVLSLRYSRAMIDELIYGNRYWKNM